MKRTQVVDAEKLKLKKRTIVQLEDQQLQNVTGGCKGDTLRSTCSSRLCSGA